MILLADSNSTEPLLQYGVLGFFAILMLAYIRLSYKRDAERADRLEEEVKNLHDKMENEVMQTLTQTNQALAQIATILQHYVPPTKPPEQ